MDGSRSDEFVVEFGTGMSDVLVKAKHMPTDARNWVASGECAAVYDMERLT